MACLSHTSEFSAQQLEKRIDIRSLRVLTPRKENGSGGHTFEYDRFEGDKVL